MTGAGHGAAAAMGMAAVFSVPKVQNDSGDNSNQNQTDQDGACIVCNYVEHVFTPFVSALWLPYTFE